MARNHQQITQDKLKALQKKRNDRDRKFQRLPSQGYLSDNQSMRLDDAHEFIEKRDFKQAETTLLDLERSLSKSPEVLRGLMVVYQSTGDHSRCAAVSRRLVEVTPDDDEAWIMYAQESAHCGRSLIALNSYRYFVDHWPTNKHAPIARSVIEMLSKEVEKQLNACRENEQIENAEDLLKMHEMALEGLHSHDFRACIVKCKALLAKYPTFASARNNLAICYFQVGKLSEAVAVVEETVRLKPNNRFSKAMLGKLYFLSGRPDDANRVADQIVVSESLDRDALMATMEMFGLLGRDDDLSKVCGAARKDELDDIAQASLLHYQAYVAFRSGKTMEARSLWKQSRKIHADCTEASGNLEDIKVNGGHATWLLSTNAWISPQEMQAFVEFVKMNPEEMHHPFSHFESLIPSMFDRGDPAGREFGMLYAKWSDTPKMRVAIQFFGLSNRGPDSMRMEALNYLARKDLIGLGPHQFFVQGNWKSIELMMTEIYSDPKPDTSSPRVQQLMEKGIQALHSSSFVQAESCFVQILEEEPNNSSAINNLCFVWSNRDGLVGAERARLRLERLLQDDPDYVFARISLAMMLVNAGEFKNAREILAPAMKARRLHLTEARGIYVMQAHIAIVEKEFEQAQRFYDMLEQMGEKDEPSVKQLKQKIQLGKTPLSIMSLKNLLNRGS